MAADYAPRIVHRDEDKFAEDGRTGRFILPSQPGRKFDCSTRFVTETGGRLRPPMLEFWTRFGDTSVEERKRYSDPSKAPARAMKTFEGDRWVNRVNKEIRKAYKLQVLDCDLDGTKLSWNSAWFHVIDQANVYDEHITAGRGPIANMGVSTEFVVNPATRRPYRDAANKEMKRECFTFDVSFLSAPGTVQKVRVATAPLERRAYDVEVIVIDSQGGPNGAFIVRMDGKIVAEYRGPLGYYDLAGVRGGGAYTGIGSYRQYNAVEPFGVRVIGLREEVAA